MTQLVMISPPPPSSFSGIAGSQLIQNMLNGMSSGTLEGLAGHAGDFPEGHVVLGLGAGHIAAPMLAAGIQSGLFRDCRLLLVDINPSNPITSALFRFANDRRLKVQSMKGNGIIAQRDGGGRIPGDIVEKIREIGISGAGVSLINGIGVPDKGSNQLNPRSTSQNVVILKEPPSLQLARMTLTPADKEREKTVVAFHGSNQRLWVEGLKERDFVVPSSFFIAPSWVNPESDADSDRFPGIFAQAKRKLEDDAKKWRASHGNEFGRYRVVRERTMPMFGKTVDHGLLSGLAWHVLREERGRNVSQAELGAIALYGTIDDKFNHAELQRDGALLDLSGIEREVAHVREIASRRIALGNAVPEKLELPMSPDQTDELLIKHLRCKENWRAVLVGHGRFENL